MNKTAILILLITACTENERARTYGGTARYCLDPGEKLVTMTWKGNGIWFLTRPMREGEVPEKYKFEESSAFGVMQGTIIVREFAAGDTGGCR